MRRGMPPFTAVLALSLVALLTAAGAMHADQQGKWDWFVEGVGLVAHATLHERGRGPKVVVVATANGTLAALRTRAGGSIKWRKVFAESDSFVCVASTGAAVAAATAQGKIVVADAASGVLAWTAQVALGLGEVVAGCAAQGEKPTTVTVAVAVVTSGGSAISVAVASEDTQKRLHEAPVPVGGSDAISDVQCSPQWCWIAHGALSALPAFTPGGLVASPMRGSLRGVAGPAAAVACGESATPAAAACLLKIVKGKIVETRRQELRASTSAEPVGFAITVAPGVEGGEPELVTISRDGEALNIAANSAAIATVAIEEVRGSMPLALAARRGDKLELLLRTSDSHLHFIAGDSVAWSRSEGLSSVDFVKFGELPDVTSDGEGDRFGFNELVFLQSRFGRLYALETAGHGKVRWSANTLQPVAERLGHAPAGCRVLQLLAENNRVAVTARCAAESRGFQMQYEGTTGLLLAVVELANLARVAGHLAMDAEGRASVVPGATFHMHEVDSAAGLVRGHMVESGTDRAVEAWRVKLGYPIIAAADGRNPLAVSSVEALRVVPNATTKVRHVRRKYPTHNVIAVAGLIDDASDPDAEFPTLELVLIDAVSGSVLARGAIPNVDGAVRLAIVENVVLFHYLDVKRMRYNLGVWELYEPERYATTESTTATPGQIITSFFTSGKRTFSSLSGNPPQIFAQTLAFQLPEVRTIGVTTSFYGIARKQVLFGTASGRVAALPLTALLIGGQPNPKKPEEQLSSVSVPSHLVVSHNNVVANIRIIASTPTQLESSAHTVTVGLDIFYIRLSSGKAFDLLNDDFNFNMLLAVCGAFALAGGVSRALARRSALRLQWA